jgi:hypothetical protein
LRKAQNGSRFNATKHGIFADILLTGEPWGESEGHYLRLLSALRGSIRPVDSLEEIQVEKLAFLYLRLTRLYKADVEVAPKLFKKVSQALDEDHSTVETKWVNKEDEVVVVTKDPAPDSFMHYENNLERQIGRTFDQLEALRRVRLIEPELSKE